MLWLDRMTLALKICVGAKGSSYTKEFCGVTKSDSSYCLEVLRSQQKAGGHRAKSSAETQKHEKKSVSESTELQLRDQYHR